MCGTWTQHPVPSTYRSRSGCRRTCACVWRSPRLKTERYTSTLNILLLPTNSQSVPATILFGAGWSQFNGWHKCVSIELKRYKYQVVPRIGGSQLHISLQTVHNERKERKKGASRIFKTLEGRGETSRSLHSRCKVLLVPVK